LKNTRKYEKGLPSSSWRRKEGQKWNQEPLNEGRKYREREEQRRRIEREWMLCYKLLC